MPGLKIIILTNDAERLRGALAVAAAHAASGGAATLFFQMDAVALLAHTEDAPRDAAHQASGLPTLSQLHDEALELGVGLIACQSGLALAGITSDALDPRVTTGGTIAFLQSVADDDRLLLV